MTSTLVHAFFGMAMFMGLRHMYHWFAVVYCNLTRPRPVQHPYSPRPAPVPPTWDYCIGCGKLAREDAMGWNGCKLLCPACLHQERV